MFCLVRIEVVLNGLIEMFKQTYKSLLDKYNIKLSLNIGILNAEINFKNNDKKAAWELYIELLTKITTQPLLDDDGIEKAALDSVYSIFSITREILKKIWY